MRVPVGLWGASVNVRGVPGVFREYQEVTGALRGVPEAFHGVSKGSKGFQGHFRAFQGCSRGSPGHLSGSQGTSKGLNGFQGVPEDLRSVLPVPHRYAIHGCLHLGTHHCVPHPVPARGLTKRAESK